MPTDHRLAHRPPLCPRLQRGDAEVSQKLWRVVRACVELGDKNPIEQIHDQVGGGGMGCGDLYWARWRVGGWLCMIWLGSAALSMHVHARPTLLAHHPGAAALPLPLQGAGGNCNVVKEIIYPLGAEIDVRAIRLGDKTMR